MFEHGLNQAHGLKRWFSPAPTGRFDLVSVNADHAICALARQIDQLFISEGIAARWQDPAGLLRHLGLPFGADCSADILIAATRAREANDPRTDFPLGTVFAAKPESSILPMLYAAIKEADERDDQAPLTVVWSDWSADRQQKNLVCEQNLANTVRKFLGRSMTFLKAPAGWADAMPDRMGFDGNPPAFLAPLTELLKSSVEQPLRCSPIFDN